MAKEGSLRSRVLEKLDKIEDLPSLPAVINRLTAAISDKSSSAEDVAKIMEDDPAIMARVLKVVNSAFYPNMSNREITSVRHAVVRLGYDAVLNIALTTSVFSVFKEDHAMAFNRKEFWRHCIVTGLISNVVCGFSDKRSVEGLQQDSVALAGLLHDMGKIILEQYFYDAFTEILKFGKEKQMPLYEIESEAFGISHAEIGAWLARKWKLGDDLVSAIQYHHNPQIAPEQYREITSLVHVADYICNMKNLGQSGNSVPPYFNQDVWDMLGLKIEMITVILEAVDSEAKKSEILLALN